MDLIVFGFIILLLTWIIIRLERRLTYWSRHGVKGQGQFEMIKRFFSPYGEYSLEMVKKYGRVHGAHGLTTHTLIVNDPDLIRELYVARAGTFRDRFNYNVYGYMVDHMMPSLPGDSKWKRIRSLVTPVFTAKKIRGMMHKISLNAEKLANNLEQFSGGGPIKMKEFIMSFTMDVICVCAYGFDPDSINNPDHPFVVNMKKLLDANVRFGLIISIIAPKLARLLNCQLLEVEHLRYFAEQGESMIDKTEFKEGSKAENLIMLLQEAHNGASTKHDSFVSKEEMIAQVIVFFIGGAETTSAAINHVIYYMAKNKDCQQKLYEELKDVDQSSFENIIQLKYLNAVINETLRLAPSVMFATRVCAEDTEINGIKIKAGTQTEVMLYALHRDPEYWQDPLEFKPERFLEPTHNPGAYLPFGSGPRNCPAERFALNELRICCAKLFARFEFSLPPGFELGYFNGLPHMTLKKLEVQLKTRN